MLCSVLSILCVEQQLRTEIEQLKTANKGLLAQVELHKDELTTANESKNA